MESWVGSGNEANHLQYVNAKGKGLRDLSCVMLSGIHRVDTRWVEADKESQGS